MCECYTINVKYIFYVFATILFGLSTNSAQIINNCEAEWNIIESLPTGITNYAKTIEFHPEDTLIIYAGTAQHLYKSIDGCNTWESILNGSVNTIIINERNPNIVFTQIGLTIQKSLDSGLTWIQLDSGIYQDNEVHLSTLAVDPFNVDTLYAGLSGVFGGTIFRSFNGGLTWDHIGQDSELLGDNIRKILVHPYNRNIIFAGGGWYGKLYKSIDYGDNWTTVLDTSWNVFPVLVNVGEGNEELELLAYGSKGLLRFTDETWVTLADSTYNISSMDYLFNNEVLLIISVKNQGIYYSSINELIWTPCGLGLDNGIVKQLLFNRPKNTLYAATTNEYSADPNGFYYIQLFDGTINIYDEIVHPNNIDIISAYPNPFNNHLIIDIRVDKNDYYSLEIVNILGEKVLTLWSGNLRFGTHNFLLKYFDVETGIMASGIYFIVLNNDGSNQYQKSFKQIKKISYLK